MLPYQPDGSPVGGQGTFTFSAFAVDQEGQRMRLGRTTVTVDNDGAVVPFGAIDRPEPGSLYTGNSGSSVILDIQAWALARRGLCLDGVSRSTWRVYLDGAPIPDVLPYFHGGNPRSDVRDAFPASCRSLESGVTFWLPTALVTNGQHTLSIEAVDPTGNVGAFGSRFFNVLVPGGDAPTDAAAKVEAAEQREARPGWRNDVRIRRSGGTSVPFEPDDYVVIRPDHQGVHAIDMQAGSRLWLELGGPVTGGRQRVAGTDGDLPGGSRLDPVSGVFTWEPPLGYFGRFDLVFDTPTGPLAVVITILR